MLSLKNITKNYQMGDMTVEALKGISIDFRENEFVAILGQSGCGKTTMLNIIGGLDRYTQGDLIIDGVSTKKYKDRDWDTYRNHKIGFVFQSYNLIPHQTVLSNVELALTLSGVSKAERRRRAIDVLEKVGLKDQMKKKPNQMSGGQMQRVAIARALINDPDILLADEPTGALDSETSVQIMEILHEIAKDKLIVMVTHNPELAEKYANRIIRLVDGRVISDSSPFSAEQKLLAAPPKVRKTSMSFFTALSLSLNNLMTKKGRTILTSFAGSIGIIGIALILSLSNGVQEYIDDIQHDTLASYPLMIDNSSTDMSSYMSSAMKERRGKLESNRPLDKIYTDNRMGDMLMSMYEETSSNDLKSFKAFLDSNEEVKKNVTNIEYSYNLEMQIFSENEDGIVKVNPSNVLDEIGFGAMAGMFSLGSQFSSSMSTTNIFTELTDNDDMFDTRYELIKGRIPEKMDEAVLIIDKYNEISDYTLYSLRMRDSSELKTAIREMMQKKGNGEISEVSKGRDYTYDEMLDLTFSVVPTNELYQKNEDGVWEDMTEDADYLKEITDNGVKLKIVGIIREKENSTALSGRIGYTKELTEYISGIINASDIVKEQKENEEYDVFTGLPFENTDAGDKAIEDAKAEAEKRAQEAEELRKQLEDAEALRKQYEEETAAAAAGAADAAGAPAAGFDISLLPEEQQAMLAQLSPEEQQAYISQIMMQMPDNSQTPQVPQADEAVEQPEQTTDAFIPAEMPSFDISSFDMSSFDPNNISDEQMMLFMSMSDEDKAELMKMFSGSSHTSDVLSSSSYFDNLTKLGVIDLDTPYSIAIYPIDFEAKENIVKLIDDYNDSVEESKVITYTDIVGMLMSSVTDIINAISYILIAFVAISLVVSSIMIGIITYISVLERTKEIGILRSIGASKKDISRVFNAETFIIGLISGCIGIGVTVLLIIPINIIIENITDIANLASLPPVAAAILIVISVVLTVIAGLMPSGVAAKKDPVVALRTE